MTNPSKEAIEAAQRWLEERAKFPPVHPSIKFLAGSVHASVEDLAALLDAHYLAGEARGLERAEMEMRHTYPITTLLAAEAIRALKPEGRPKWPWKDILASLPQERQERIKSMSAPKPLEELLHEWSASRPEDEMLDIGEEMARRLREVAKEAEKMCPDDRRWLLRVLDGEIE